MPNLEFNDEYEGKALVDYFNNLIKKRQEHLPHFLNIDTAKVMAETQGIEVCDYKHPEYDDWVFKKGDYVSMLHPSEFNSEAKIVIKAKMQLG